MFSKSFLAALLCSSCLLQADDINSFTSDETNVTAEQVINLTLDLIVTKKYEIRLSAYNAITNIQLTPSFNAVDIKHIEYKVPSEADYDIKLIAQLIEDYNVVRSKEIILDATATSGLYFCSEYETFAQELHPNSVLSAGCFKPQPYIEYNLVYGDDRAVMLLTDGNQGISYRGNDYNSVALNTNTKIHYYNKSSYTSFSGTGCIGNCKSTFLGISEDEDIYNSSDTESRITATYEPDENRVKIISRGGYYSCSCSVSNCCSEWLTYTKYIELN